MRKTNNTPHPLIVQITVVILESERSHLVMETQVCNRQGSRMFPLLRLSFTVTFGRKQPRKIKIGDVFMWRKSQIGGHNIYVLGKLDWYRQSRFILLQVMLYLLKSTTVYLFILFAVIFLECHVGCFSCQVVHTFMHACTHA